jgi:hypothetical protein
LVSRLEVANMPGFVSYLAYKTGAVFHVAYILGLHLYSEAMFIFRVGSNKMPLRLWFDIYTLVSFDWIIRCWCRENRSCGVGDEGGKGRGNPISAGWSSRSIGAYNVVSP